jgi:hypothetical protein
VRAALFPLLAGLAASSVFAAPSSDQAKAEPERPRLNCQSGPAERYFDGVQWYVFACDDGASIVVITGPKSPDDLNFYFIIFPKDGVYKLHGEGNGDKALTRPAFEALSAMSGDDFRKLHAEAMSVARAIPGAS